MDRHLKMGWLYCCTAVESIIGHSDQEIKIKLSQDILDELDKREGEYSICKKLIWDRDKPLDGIIGDSLLANLTRFIGMQCGYEMTDFQGVSVISNLADNMILQIKISELFINVMESINFKSIVKEVVKIN